MSQNPNDIGVWRPPAAEPSWFTPAPRLPRPDARVWPPPAPEQEEPRGSSTVPMPAVQDGQAPGRRAWPPPPPVPAASPPPGPAASPFRGEAPAERAAAAPAAPAPAPPMSLSSSPSAAPPAPTAPPPADRAASAAAPSGRRRMPRPAKIGLQLLGAVALTAALLGVKGYDQLTRFERDNPAAQVRHVASGQAADLADARWRLLKIAPMAQQPDNLAPGTIMLQIDLEGTPLNQDGTRFTTTPPYYYTGDAAGRTWMALSWKAPERLTPGVPGRFTLISSVPKDVAGQVELLLWPNSYVGEREWGPALRFAR
ncbi:hypothetical protein [Sphaerisporangium rhizosphaerae]|uniref:DUF4352 domain-containing protein n=1 Tax=Sphaerisporangium rhizosphaerae TaxID=2269375 RepID=A0ABW2NZ46_9ACTN